MKTCKRCGQDDQVVRFRGYRKTCYQCELEIYNERARQKRAASEPVAPPVVAPGPQVPPEVAEHYGDAANRVLEYSVQQAKLELARENKSLIGELKKRDKLIAELGKLNLPPEIIVYDKPVWERADAVACALASDWHVEEPVDKATVHGLNEYNLEIAKLRAQFFFKHLLRLAELQARDCTITSIWIGFLGDFFSGWIHEELLANCLLAPGEAALFVKSLLCSGIQYLLDNSSFNIEGDMLPGNHGRMTKRVFSGNPTGTSLETAMYQHVADWFRNEPRVRLRVASQSMVYRRFFERFTMRMIHGYEVNYQGGVGGLTIPLRKALAQWNNPIRANLTVLGHFHQLLDGGDFLVNGSLIGYNLFAQTIKAAFEEARQVFFMVQARNGGEKSLVAPIWLDEAHKEPRRDQINSPPAVPV